MVTHGMVPHDPVDLLLTDRGGTTMLPLTRSEAERIRRGPPLGVDIGCHRLRKPPSLSRGAEGGRGMPAPEPMTSRFDGHLSPGNSQRDCQWGRRVSSPGLRFSPRPTKSRLLDHARSKQSGDVSAARPPPPSEMSPRKVDRTFSLPVPRIRSARIAGKFFDRWQSGRVAISS